MANLFSIFFHPILLAIRIFIKKYQLLIDCPLVHGPNVAIAKVIIWVHNQGTKVANLFSIFFVSLLLAFKSQTKFLN